LLELRGAGHCPMLEQPEAVNAALTELIVAASSPAASPAYPVEQPTARRRRKVAP